MSRLDARPSRFDILAPPSGGVDRRVVHEGVDLTGEAWRWLVQPAGDLEPNPTTPIFEATFTGGDGESQLVFSDEDVAKVSVGTDRKLFVLRDGKTVASGTFTRSKTQTDAPQDTIVLALADQSFTLTILGGGGPELATELPLGPTEGGAVGTSTRAAREDHQHPPGPGGGELPLYDTYLPIAIEFIGGEFTGPDTAQLPSSGESGVVLLSEQADPANNGPWQVDTSGVATRLPSPLTAGNVGALLLAQLNPLAGNAPEVLRVAGENEVEVLVVSEAQVQALIDAAVAPYALAADLDAVLYGDPTRRTAHFAGPHHAMRSPNLGDITGTFAHISRFRVDFDPTTDTYLEFRAQTDDNEQHSVELFEAALYVGDPDGQFTPLGFDGTPELGKLYPFWEQQRIGDEVEGVPLVAYNSTIVPGEEAGLLFEVNTGTETALIAQEDPDGLLSAYGSTWTVLVTDTDERWSSFKAGVTEPWFTGWDFEGVIFESEDYIDGQRIAGWDADALTPGASEFVDVEGNPVELSSGVRILRSWGELSAPLTELVERVTTLEEAAPSAPVGWQVVTDQILDATTATVDVAIPEGCTALRIRVAGLSTRDAVNDTLRMRFNNNTGNVYSTNATALTSFLAVHGVPGVDTNSNRRQIINVDLDVGEGFTKVGTVRASTIISTSTVGQAVTNVALFSTITDAVTSLQLFMQHADIAAGTRITVECLA